MMESNCSIDYCFCSVPHFFSTEGLNERGENGEVRVVCVTGGSGYIASWLVKFLLVRGYTVKATVTDPDDPIKTQHLRGLDGAKERLQLLKANLMEEGVFDAVVDGCEGVFHVASPVNVAPKDPQNDVIGPAVNGTLNVLKSCAKVPSIRRVVVTSSMASVTTNGKPLTHDVVVDETWFSDPVFCEENKLWYRLSKILAEDATWKFAKENGIDVVTIHPGWVISPFLQPNINLTVEVILNHIKGSTYPNEIFRFVDVRDVAKAHILAFERVSARGRYCMVRNVTHCSEFLTNLRQLFPTLSLPQKCADDKPFVEKYEVSKEKVKTELGLEYTPLEVTIKDTIQCLKERGFLHF